MTLGIDAEPTTVELERFLGLQAAKPFFKMLSGTAPVHVDAEIGLTREHLAVTGHTDLSGITSSLPQPFEKALGTKWPTTFSVTLPDKAMHVDVSSPGRAAVSLRFVRGKGDLTLTHGFAGFGNVRMQPPVTASQSASIRLKRLSTHGNPISFKRKLPQRRPQRPPQPLTAFLSSMQKSAPRSGPAKNFETST